ncbi:hypothetical protein AB5I39_09700 [Sphingomonas sp. MMS24-J45]|uniref:hypothetical protein n=1 Tax=Sphingomonas sp. MMS24-J45 TaxID=3238806 RepID=UPI00384E8514
MACPLPIPPGTVLAYHSVRIVFVEAVDDFVLRFVVEGTSDEFCVDATDGVRVRPTVRWLLEQFAAGSLTDCATSHATLTEWQGRYLGLDRAAVFAKEPRAVQKYDLALAAIIERLPRNAKLLEKFARTTTPDGQKVASGRSIIRWMNNLQTHDERIGAMRNRSGRRRGCSQLPPVVDRLVHQSMALYWADESIRKMDCHALVVHAWHRLEKDGAQRIGDRPPSKTTVVNRINKCESKETWSTKFGRHEADRYFRASGESMPIRRPFELAYIDGTEFRQVCLFSAEIAIPSSKMKTIEVMDAFSLFVFPTTPFAGPYRAEMGMSAILGALIAPVLDEETVAKDPMQLLFFGRIGRLRGDNDKAIIPPSAIGNLANVIRRVELAKKYGPDEKSNLENYFGFKKARLDGLPGTVLSARSRRRSIRRDPLAEASMTREAFARRNEELRLEWNAMGHAALGGRSPNDIILEHISQEGKVRFTPPGEIRRHLARTVKGVLTTDGVTYDGILYRWNRTGITKLLSENLASQAFAKRLEGTAKCDVLIRAYDWNLDFIEVLNDHDNQFIQLWSDDPDYTAFLSRYEHSFDVLPRIHAIGKLARQMETSDAARPIYRGSDHRRAARA